MKKGFHLTDEQVEQCKVAGKKLATKLRRAKVELMGYGVTLNKAGDGPAIRIMVYAKEDANKVPETFDGLEVATVVTGVISAQ